ncbi:translin [Plodia interpunctella]|uniref:translin n=1 Tax=Plodia interpunctella TaxID=58824 RepID=UPI0023676B0C|nr:translin [Plodia interpunctella]
MSVNNIDCIFSKFQNTLDSEQELREVIRNICREGDHISREIMSILQIIHHDSAGIGKACLRSRELFAQAKEKYQVLKETVPPTGYYKYHDHWRGMTQRYSHLAALTVWLEKGFLVSHETVAQILGISAVEQKEGFHLDIEDYLVGLLMLCSELSRLAVNAVTQGDHSRPLQISKFVMELNAGFRLLNLKNDHLRKRFDALKYDVKKIEEVVYDLSIRGLLPRVDPEAEAPSSDN